MKEQRLHSAGTVFVFKPVGRLGAIEVSIYGLLDEQPYLKVRPKIRAITDGAPGVIYRLDTGLTVMAHPPTPSAEIYQPDDRPQAIVVRPEFLREWHENCRLVAEFGAIRTVFSSDQSDLAYRWVDQALEIRQTLGRPARPVEEFAVSGPSPLL
jgi:hypothetical protein